MVSVSVLYDSSCYNNYLRQLEVGGSNPPDPTKMVSKMEWNERQLHLKAAWYLGRERSCGKKVRHPTYEDAKYIADKHNYTNADKMIEAYPCPFCKKWHVGRMMSREELETYARLGFKLALVSFIDRQKELLKALANFDMSG